MHGYAHPVNSGGGRGGRDVALGLAAGLIAACVAADSLDEGRLASAGERTGRGGAPIVAGYLETLRGGLKLEDVPFGAADLVIHAFAYPDAAGVVRETENYERYRKAGVVRLAHAAGARILVGVGGASRSGNFAAVAADAARRAAFVGAIADHVRANGYDGVDIDWEFPCGPAE